MSYKDLSNRIIKFLEEYALLTPEYKATRSGNKYTSPDAKQMEVCAEDLANGIRPTRCWSEYRGGGYAPRNSADGMKEHDELMKLIYDEINGKK